MKRQPDEKSVLDDPQISQQQPMANDQRNHRNVHRIAYVAVEPGDHKMTGWENRRWGSQALERKAATRSEQHRKTGRDQEPTGNANGSKAQQSALHLPP